VAWTRRFPGAEIHAIDVAAPMLRYGHARAEAYGATIHFSQQNAEKTNFPAGHFDLVYSHILTHETATTAYHNIIKESFRLLKPGGLMIHQETHWETHYNAEPFKTKLDTLNLQQIAEKAGFKAKNVFFETIPSEQAGTKYYRGQWNLFGAWKK
jgi:ubiquinone/menaquinone biosynthesis C-methylase UbiE